MIVGGGAHRDKGESTEGNPIRRVVGCQEMFFLYGIYTGVRFLSFFPVLFFFLSGT